MDAMGLQQNGTAGTAARAAVAREIICRVVYGGVSTEHQFSTV